MICGSGASKSRLAKAAGAEPAGQMRDGKLHAVLAPRHVEVRMYKAHQVGPLLEVEMMKKVHAVVVRSTFPSQNVPPQCQTIFES